MPAILDLPEVRARVWLLSVETYDALTEMGVLEKQAELIRGVIVRKRQVSAAPEVDQTDLLFLLALQRSEMVVFMEAPLRLMDSEPEPGVMVVRGEESDFDSAHPKSAELVIEVTVGSAALDRENASLYAENCVTEYWIVLGEEQRIKVYHQPESGVYQQKRLYSLGETVACESVPGLQVALAEWFA